MVGMIDLLYRGHGFSSWPGNLPAPGHSPAYNNFGPVVHPLMPLSPSSIIWYWSTGKVTRLGLFRPLDQRLINCPTYLLTYLLRFDMITLTMCHRLSGIPIYRLSHLRQGKEHPTMSSPMLAQEL